MLKFPTGPGEGCSEEPNLLVVFSLPHPYQKPAQPEWKQRCSASLRSSLYTRMLLLWVCHYLEALDGLRNTWEFLLSFYSLGKHWQSAGRTAKRWVIVRARYSVWCLVPTIINTSSIYCFTYFKETVSCFHWLPCSKPWVWMYVFLTEGPCLGLLKNKATTRSANISLTAGFGADIG